MILEDNFFTLLENIHEDIPVVGNGRISIEFTIDVEAEGDFKLSSRAGVAEDAFEFGQVFVEYFNKHVTEITCHELHKAVKLIVTQV